MRREAFRFITELIITGKPGMKITRVQVIKHMLSIYKPGIKDHAQASCRNVGDRVLHYYVRKGILKRISRGEYEIVTPLSAPIIYEEVSKELI